MSIYLPFATARGNCSAGWTAFAWREPRVFVVERVYYATAQESGIGRMTTERPPGFHVRPDGAVDASAYEQFTGRWSRLFVPLVLEAADVQPCDQVLDVCTGTGEVAIAIAPAVGASGCLIGVDIAHAMLKSARGRLRKLCKSHQHLSAIATGRPSAAAAWGTGRDRPAGNRTPSRARPSILAGTP